MFEGAEHLGEFFRFMQDLILFSPIYDLLFFGFVVMCAFTILKHSSKEAK